MEGIVFNGCKLNDAEIIDCNLKDSRFELKTMEDLYLTGNDISNADFSAMDEDVKWKEFWQYNTNSGQYQFSSEIMDSIVTLQDLILEEQENNEEINMYELNLDMYFGKDGIISTRKYPLREYDAEKDSIWSIIE